MNAPRSAILLIAIGCAAILGVELATAPSGELDDLKVVGPDVDRRPSNGSRAIEREGPPLTPDTLENPARSTVAPSPPEPEEVHEPAEEDPPLDFSSLEEKYHGWTKAQLTEQSKVLKAQLLARANRLLDERYERGLIEIKEAPWNEEMGGYMFSADPDGPLSRHVSIRGTSQFMEYVELPFHEYPEIYELDEERKWVTTKAYWSEED